MPKIPAEYENNVFINCPFDSLYYPLFNAIVFTVHDAGFRPRCALEVIDGGQFRLEKIMNIILECRYGIHDISRTERDKDTKLPRFNMPLELGLDIGCRNFGSARYRNKNILILDTEPHRYQKFISDIAGQDINAHAGEIDKAIGHVRNWLRTASGKRNIPSGSHIHLRYESFNLVLPDLCRELRLDLQALHFVDFSFLIVTWLHKLQYQVS
jgi:hypothetical protein